MLQTVGAGEADKAAGELAVCGEFVGKLARVKDGADLLPALAVSRPAETGAAPRDPQLMREENLKKIEEHLKQVHRLAALSGLTMEDLQEMLVLMKED